MSTAVIGAPEFRARSGRKVQIRDNGTVTFDHANGYLSPETAMDAEEFFQYQRDLERGWWRWPENPTCVVKEGEPNDFGRGRTVYVFDEESFDRFHFNERVRDADGGTTIAHRAARAYFEAHPERKPWHNAKPEEVWVMSSGQHEFVAMVMADGRFQFADGSFMHVTEEFVDGRRIFTPEDAS